MAGILPGGERGSLSKQERMIDLYLWIRELASRLHSETMLLTNLPTRLVMVPIIDGSKQETVRCVDVIRP